MATPFDLPIDYILLAGQKSPGLCELVGLERKRKFLGSPAFGSDGENLRYTGKEPCEFDAKFRLYDAEDYTSFWEWHARVGKAPRDNKGGLQITHPFCEELGVASVVITSTSAPVQTDDGEWTVTMRFREMLRPRIALQKVEGSKTNTVRDPWDDYLEELTGQVQELAGP